MKEYSKRLTELLENENDFEMAMEQELDEFTNDLRKIVETRLEKRKGRLNRSYVDSSALSQDVRQTIDPTLCTPTTPDRQVLNSTPVMRSSSSYDVIENETYICGRSLMDPQTPVSYLRSPVDLKSALSKPIVFCKQPKDVRIQQSNYNYNTYVLPESTTGTSVVVTEILDSPMSVHSQSLTELENGMGDKIYAHHYESDISVESANTGSNKAVLCAAIDSRVL